MTTYTYLCSETPGEFGPEGLWTVGHVLIWKYGNHVWIPESDHDTEQAAIDRVAELNRNPPKAIAPSEEP